MALVFENATLKHFSEKIAADKQLELVIESDRPTKVFKVTRAPRELSTENFSLRLKDKLLTIISIVAFWFA